MDQWSDQVRKTLIPRLSLVDRVRLFSALTHLSADNWISLPNIALQPLHDTMSTLGFHTEHKLERVTIYRLGEGAVSAFEGMSGKERIGWFAKCFGEGDAREEDDGRVEEGMKENIAEAERVMRFSEEKVKRIRDIAALEKDDEFLEEKE